MKNLLHNKNIVITIITIIIFLTIFSSVFGQRGLENFRWFTSNIAVSGEPSESDYTYLYQKQGVRAVLDVEIERDDPVDHITGLGMDYLLIPIWDTTAPTLEESIQAADWINARLAEGKKVLIHCGWGIGRAPTTAAIWYVSQEHTADDAIDWISQFPTTDINDYQKQAIRDYADYIGVNEISEFRDASSVTIFIFIISIFVVLLLKEMRKR